MNIFKRPVETETLDAWAKWLEDLAKICIVALPIVIYGQYSSGFKVANSTLIILGCYAMMLAARFIRRNKEFLSSREIIWNTH